MHANFWGFSFLEKEKERKNKTKEIRILCVESLEMYTAVPY